jgi:hypothetical protein
MVVIALLIRKTEETFTDQKENNIAFAEMVGSCSICTLLGVHFKPQPRHQGLLGFQDFSESLPETDRTVPQLYHHPFIQNHYQSLSINNHSHNEAILSALLTQTNNWSQKYFSKNLRRFRADQEDKRNPRRYVPIAKEQTITMKHHNCIFNFLFPWCNSP